MNRAQRFTVLREHLAETGWWFDGGTAMHPLLGRHQLLDALVLNGLAAAGAAMAELGLVHNRSRFSEPGIATC